MVSVNKNQLIFIGVNFIYRSLGEFLKFGFDFRMPFLFASIQLCYIETTQQQQAVCLYSYVLLRSVKLTCLIPIRSYSSVIVLWVFN